jgi:hypothetical protein
MELLLKITGLLLVVLALIHVPFPARFEWKKDLSGLNLLNRQLMYVHTFFIALTVLLMGLLCITSANELVHTPLGRRISFGLFIFWLLRLFTQFFGFSAELWKGKKFETVIHVLFSIFWVYLSVIFFMAYWMNGNV